MSGKFAKIIFYFKADKQNLYKLVLRVDWSRFINGNRINRISDSERQVLKTDW